MLHEGGLRRREWEVGLEWASGGDDRIVVHTKRVEVKGYPVTVVMLHIWRLWLVERVFVQFILMVRFIGYHDAVDGWDVRGEIGGTLPGLDIY